MEMLAGLLVGTQLIFTFVAGLYFFTMLKSQQGNKTTIKLESKKEIESLRKLRGIKLTEPLSEKTRPSCFEEIIGQDKAVKALKAAICGANPQHVLIYGSPGVGKTAAARIVLEHAKKSKNSPFMSDAPFVEMDATILQFDERSIADPLIGSVHDPIYQGAGSYGQAGVPQPKMGAVTKAHGGLLFLDEIGELHNLQMNKLLKVLEDRKVIFSSSYYSSEDSAIPKHVHDIFKNGLPADFRLVGATTRSPEEIPPALRSRCTEIFFRQLNDSEIAKIARNSFKKSGFLFDENAVSIIARHSSNGRDTVNIVQTASSIAALDNRRNITVADVEEVIEYGRYLPKSSRNQQNFDRVGVVNGLAVTANGTGAVLEVEATSGKSYAKSCGYFKATGIIEQEEFNNRNGKMRRQGTAKSSIDNVQTVLGKVFGIKTEDLDIHINFPGGTPVDGPSAGIAVFTAVYSAINNIEIPNKLAMTGEVTIKARVAPVGGVASKIEAAVEAGMEKVIIPKANYQRAFDNYPIRIICVEDVNQVLEEVFGTEDDKATQIREGTGVGSILTAKQF